MCKLLKKVVAIAVVTSMVLTLTPLMSVSAATMGTTLLSTFTNDLDGWSMIASNSGNRMVWKDGKVSTSIVDVKNDDWNGSGTNDAQVDGSGNSVASNRYSFLRPTVYEGHKQLTDYAVSMDFGMSENCSTWFETCLIIRAQGEPNRGAQTLPTNGYAVKFYDGKLYLGRLNASGQFEDIDQPGVTQINNFTSKPFKFDRSKTYNVKLSAIGNEISVYTAEYAGGALGEYTLQETYTDTNAAKSDKGYFMTYQRLCYNFQSSILPINDVWWLDNIKLEEPVSALAVNSNISNNAVNVPISMQPTLEFNDAIVGDTLKSSLIVTPAFDYTIALDAANKIATIQPLSDLQRNTEYNIKVPITFASTGGYNLATEYSLTFTTEGDITESGLLLSSTFDTGLDGWSMIASNSGNRMVWKEGKISTSIVDVTQDDWNGNDTQVATNGGHPIGSSRSSYFRPDNYTDYKDLTDYSVSMDYGMSNDYTNWHEVTISVRLEGEPLLGAQQVPTKGYHVRVTQDKVILARATSAGAITAVAEPAYKIDKSKKYNIKVTTEGSRIKVYTAVYTGEILGQYTEIINYKDTDSNASAKGYFMLCERMFYNNAGLGLKPLADVMWLDNVKVEQSIKNLSINSNIISGSSSVDTGKALVLKSNVPVDIQALKSAITITDKTTNTPYTAYNVVMDNTNKIATITPTNGWTFDTNFEVVIANTLTSIGGIGMLGEVKIAFTTGGRPLEKENLLTSTFDGNLDGWAMLANNSGNRMVWKDGKVSTTIVSKDDDDIGAPWSVGPEASTRNSFLRPVDYNGYKTAKNYEIAMDVGYGTNANPYVELGVLIRVQGEPLLGEQKLPSNGYMLKLSNNKLSFGRIGDVIKDKITYTGQYIEISSMSYPMDIAKTYNVKMSAQGDTIKAYIATYTGNVLGNYEEVVSYTDAETFKSSEGYFMMYERLGTNNASLNFMPKDFIDVMWLDNVKVDKLILPFEVKSSSVADGGANVPKNAEIAVEFTTSVNIDTLKSATTLLDVTTNKVVPAEEYTVNLSADGKTASVTMPKQFMYHHKYTLSIAGTMADNFGTLLSKWQAGGYSLSFTIEDEPMSVASVTVANIDGSTIADLSKITDAKATVVIKNATTSAKPVWLLVGAYGNGNELLGVSYVTTSAVANNTTTEIVTLSNIKVGTKVIKALIWDGENTLNPYSTPKNAVN